MEKQETNSQKNDLHYFSLQYIAAISASFATLSTGTVLGWPSQITSKLLDDDLEFTITPDELGWIYSCFALGAALLSIVIGSICDRIGRKPTMLLMIVPLEIGWLLIIFARNTWMLIFGRIFTGMIGGSYCVTVPLYIGEISHKEVRGILGGLTQFSMSCGILLANVIEKFLSVRDFSIVCAAVPLVFLLTFSNMPETPLYLQMKNKTEASKASLRKLYGKESIEEEFNEVLKYLHTESKISSTKEILQKRSVKKAFIIGVGLAFIKVFTGIDPITSYLGHIFDNTVTDLGSENAAIVFATFQVISIVPQALVIDRWGRKILLVVSQFVMAFCLFSTALCLYLKLDNSAKILDYVPVVALCTYTVAFSVGIGPIGWILTAEIFEERVKGAAMSLCTFLMWFSAFGNIKIFEIVENSLGISVPIFVYAGVSLLAMFFILGLVPETKNKTFSEIEKELSR